MIITVYQNSTGGKEAYNESLKLNRSAQFLNYVSAFDSFYLTNGSKAGDVTDSVTLPSWIPVDKNIRMYISAGTGYVFMPSNSGVLSEIMKNTDYSSLVGFSDGAYITTLSGKINKPAFIPVGYIVYVR